MKKLLATAILLGLSGLANAQQCPAPLCDTADSCAAKAAWIAEGEAYNIHIHWSDKKQANVADFDFAIESWVKGEMTDGHFLHFKTNHGCKNQFDMESEKSGWYRVYGGSKKGEILFMEKLED